VALGVSGPSSTSYRQESLEAKVGNIGVNMNHDFDNVTLPKLKSCAVLATKLFKCFASCALECLIIVLHSPVQGGPKNCTFLQGSVETGNRCCGQYMHCFVGNLFRCKSAKNYKIRLRFHKAISI